MILNTGVVNRDGHLGAVASKSVSSPPKAREGQIREELLIGPLSCVTDI